MHNFNRMKIYIEIMKKIQIVKIQTKVQVMKIQTKI